MLKGNKEINAKDGQRYPIKEMKVVPFVYYTVIFIYSKLDSKEPMALHTPQPCFTYVLLYWKSGLTSRQINSELIKVVLLIVQILVIKVE